MALAVTTDVTDCDQVTGFVDTAVQEHGRIDVMVNNAGLMPQAPLEHLKVDKWDRMIAVSSDSSRFSSNSPPGAFRRWSFPNAR